MEKASISHIMSLICVAALVTAGCIETGAPPDRGNDTPAEAADYLILAPKTLFVGSESSISMSAFAGKEHAPTKRQVEYALLDSEETKVPLVRASTGKSGHSVARFEVPPIEEGTYSLIAEPVGTDERYNATVRVLKSNPIFIETDKPIYKPGQTIHGRVILLNNNLLPLADSVELEIADAKGIKIFRETLETNVFGVSTFDLPLSTEPNLGTWKIKAVSGESKSVVDIRVERYVLPKFEIESDVLKDWFLVSDQITGTVSANYFFGKPVEGSVEIEAIRYVGTWETYATYSAVLENGSVEFELPAVGWIAGTYGAGGQGSLMLNISVTDTGNHTETSTELLKIVESDMILHLIPESSITKPGLPFGVLIVTEDPDGNPVDTDVEIRTLFREEGYTETGREDTVLTENGGAILDYTIPLNCTGAHIEATCRDTSGSTVHQSVELDAAYSPGASFIHIAQTSEGVPHVGDTIAFATHSTNPGTVFYDIYANGRTVYSDTSERSEIAVQVTPQMSPSAKIVAYMINPNLEVSADVLPFDVRFETSVDLTSAFDSETVSPGDSVGVDFDAGEKSMIGVAIVDESVYALSAGRLNLKQVFDELERRFMEPQIEIHPEYGYYDRRIGTYEILDDAGMQVLASPSFEIPKMPEPEMPVPEVVGVWKGGEEREVAVMDMAVEEGAPMPVPAVTPTATPTSAANGELATVERVRQFFPETWLWLPDLLTDDNGRTHIDLTAPDSITTWRLHAVSSSDAGLGISEDSLTVFQEFFLDTDLPYSVTRGEVFPVRVQVYNYLDTPQDVRLTLSSGGWFNIIGDDVASVSIGANSVEDVSFTITPIEIGTHTIEITAQTEGMADAVRKDIIIEAEGTRQEIVENGNLNVGSTMLDATLPTGIVSDSGVVLVSFTPSIVAQTINGMDSLLNMPFGCGEQNMIMFAPDVEILRYLKATDQINPEIQAKAELFITTGYQRQLTFMHNDGSFSAFGESGGESGSLWLTAFVLNSFASARDVTSIDESVLAEASDWICTHQSGDGSWESIGFICHQEMIGGIEGRYALTSFVTIALAEYGGARPGVLEKAQKYLEENLDDQSDPFPLAIGSVALQKLESPRADAALEKLVGIARKDENGVYWGPDQTAVGDSDRDSYPFEYGHPPSSRNIEITSYAALALIDAKHPLANDAIKWIASQRNSFGGFSSTQDTVMALKALMTAASNQGRDIDATVTVSADGSTIKDVRIDAGNFDVLQTVLVPDGADEVQLTLTGTGEVNYQLVKRFNVILPEIAPVSELRLDIVYDATDVAVNDIVTAHTRVMYTGAAQSTGMMIVDVAVPTGFAPISESLDALVEDGTITRYETAGRKVIVYVLDLPRGVELSFDVEMRALFPVKAIVPDSRAYSYYDPKVSAGVRGGGIVVSA